MCRPLDQWQHLPYWNVPCRQNLTRRNRVKSASKCVRMRTIYCCPSRSSDLEPESNEENSRSIRYILGVQHGLPKPLSRLACDRAKRCSAGHVTLKSAGYRLLVQALGPVPQTEFLHASPATTASVDGGGIVCARLSWDRIQLLSTPAIILFLCYCRY